MEEGYPIAFCGDGDGTVSIESLQVCKNWKDSNLNNGPVNYKEYSGLDHVGILNDAGFINDFVQIIIDSQ